MCIRDRVTWADSPEGPWSTPIDLKIGGIDPEHVVSEDGDVYKRQVLFVVNESNRNKIK